MDMMAIRRRVMLGQDSKIWLIKNGVDVISNTGGYECSTRKVSGWNMSGWKGKMPVLTQEDGFLRLSVTGNPVYGSLVPQIYLSNSKILGKRIYLDSVLSLSTASYFHLLLMGNDGLTYGGREIKASSGHDRNITLSPIIHKGADDKFESVIFPMQISTRNTSYIDIYNMWIE